MGKINKIKHVCFDLDGTLTDSFRTIYLATVFTLRELKIKEKLDEAFFREKIGLHFMDIFKDMKIPVKDFNEFIDIYKRLYLDFIDESRIYPSAVKVLEYLKEQGIHISLLTTKVQEQADTIIEHFKLTKYFDYIMGRRENIPHKPSGEPLLYICRELFVKPENTLMVGDTELDILCGKNAEAGTCAAAYGYRNKKIIKELKPDFIIDDITQLMPMILPFI